MARYRKIDVKTWGDAKFRGLTAMQPCGQGLWLYLLTSPYTTNIPGLYRAGEGALADDLKWPLKGFRRAFHELALAGMASADWSGPLVWLPKAIFYNRPESPNVVKSWGNTWDEIPEVPLKLQAWQALKAFTEGLGEAFAKAFAEGCRRPRAEARRDPSPNQEQEQDQEQEQEGPPPSPSRASESPSCPDCSRAVDELNRETGRLAPGCRPFTIEAARAAGLHARHDEHGLEEVVRVIRLKCREWMPKPKMQPYCRPRTLFGPENFEEYRLERDPSREREDLPDKDLQPREYLFIWLETLRLKSPERFQRELEQLHPDIREAWEARSATVKETACPAN
jgi:uncharacterized phage protein (TIGR02220 family)